MKKFRFKLQTVLERRQAREDALLAELSKLIAEERQEQAQLGRLHVRLDNACMEIENAMNSNAPGELPMWDEYAKATRDDIKVQELTIDAIHARVEAKREELVEAMKERKVLETLRDKQEQAHILANLRAEQNELDEMASVRFARGL